MLDHLHRENGIELRPLSGKRLRVCAAVIDLKPGFRGVLLGDLDIGPRRVYRRHARALAGERFCEESRAASDIEHGNAIERAIRATIERLAFDGQKSAEKFAHIANPDGV